MNQTISANTAVSTMNDTSFEQRPAALPLLTPPDTSTLKQLWLQDNTKEFPFNEYHLNGKPESLKTFVDQFLGDGYSEHDYDQDRLIWISENSFVRMGEYRRHELPGVYRFVRVGEYRRHELPGVYRDHQFKLRLQSGLRTLTLYIHSTAPEDAMTCFDFLVGIHDDHFRQIEIYYRAEDQDEDNGPQLCPLTSRLLDDMIQQNAKRKNVFCGMYFTPDQSRKLATSGRKTDIELALCKFQDDGEAFMEALVAREDPEIGLAKLTIRYCLLFTEGNLVLFLDQLKIEALTLNEIDLETEEACRALAAAELQYLKLIKCELADGGAALVESVREGRGPKGLGLFIFDDHHDWSPFDSSERFASLLNALRGNSHLERLDLQDFGVGEDGILDSLAAALLGNIGLICLCLPGCALDESGFCEFLRAISAHPSLRTLDLTGCELRMDETEATEEVAKMLSVNKQVEEIRMGYFPFFSVSWNTLVTPRLECNIYRKRFPAIQNIRSPSTRAAVMARALSHVSNKPSPAFMLLHQNLDILASYSRVESQIATSSRKRSYSPSSDGKVGPP
jgi:hypothetical protein